MGRGQIALLQGEASASAQGSTERPLVCGDGGYVLACPAALAGPRTPPTGSVLGKAVALTRACHQAGLNVWAERAARTPLTPRAPGAVPVPGRDPERTPRRRYTTTDGVSSGDARLVPYLESC